MKLAWIIVGFMCVVVLFGAIIIQVQIADMENMLKAGTDSCVQSKEVGDSGSPKVEYLCSGGELGGSDVDCKAIAINGAGK